VAPPIWFIKAEEVKALKSLGKCPKCDAELKDSDVKEIHFRGIVISHFAYRCNKCGYIIGFGTTFRG
jgi:C4-type Zn-finger protein